VAPAVVAAAGVEAVKTIFAVDVFPKHGLLVGPHRFRCPYCDRLFERGGHAEGFRKSGANNHVYCCWEIGLYLRGYIIGDYVENQRSRGHLATPVDEVTKTTWGPRFIRSIKANIRKRRKDGVLHRLEPKQ